MQNEKVKNVTRMGMLFALAMALSFLESALCPAFGMLPAVKIGLANIVVMYTLIYMGKKQALTLVVLKAGFALITRGVTAGTLSFCGSILSYLVLCALLAAPFHTTGYILSACGAIAHNLGQIAAAAVILGTSAVWGYTPVLVLSGLVVGGLTWQLFRSLTPYLSRLEGQGTKGTGKKE